MVSLVRRAVSAVGIGGAVVIAAGLAVLAALYPGSARAWSFESDGVASFRWWPKWQESPSSTGGTAVSVAAYASNSASRFRPQGVRVYLLFKLPDRDASVGRLELDLDLYEQREQARKVAVPGNEVRAWYLEKSKGRVTFLGTSVDGELTLRDLSPGTGTGARLEIGLTLRFEDQAGNQSRTLSAGKIQLGSAVARGKSGKDPDTGRTRPVQSGGSCSTGVVYVDPEYEPDDPESAGCGGEYPDEGGGADCSGEEPPSGGEDAPDCSGGETGGGEGGSCGGGEDGASGCSEGGSGCSGAEGSTPGGGGQGRSRAGICGARRCGPSGARRLAGRLAGTVHLSVPLLLLIGLRLRWRRRSS